MRGLRTMPRVERGAWQAFGCWLLVLGAGTGCWYWVLVLVAGTGCWLLVLVAGTGCWYWLVVRAACSCQHQQPMTSNRFVVASTSNQQPVPVPVPSLRSSAQARYQFRDAQA